ncbi:HAMP domain-containing protein [Nitrosopumilus sp.]|uniref:HAMP domain-containing protein n=1 Tax=Nitrosopumilus sp. TaxID=2024843 RepID=UPI0029305FE5|nr:HAMP domain-containing protein [Nitrosopumilus sp.]
MSISFNLDKKLIFLVMLVSVVALSITGYLSFNYADEILKQRAGDQLLGESAVRGDTIRLLFESRIEQNDILTNDPMIQFLISEMNQIPEDKLKEVKETNRRDFLIQIQAFQELIGFSIGFEDVKIIGSNGKAFFSLGGITEEDFAENPLFKRGIKESFIEFEPTESGKKMIIVSPVFADDSKKGDESTGVIISRTRTTTLDSILLNRSGLGDTGEIYIVNNQLLMLSESRFFDDAVFQQTVDTLAVEKCFVERKNHLGFYEDYRDVLIYGSSYCADDLGFVLLVEIDKTEVEEPIGILQDRIFQTGIVITIGMGLVAFVISKSLSRPLIKLKSAANKITDGNFEVRTNIKTRDEIGELSHAFDSMAQKLQESLIEIKEQEDVIKQQEDILLQFSERSEKYGVGMIDIMNSTKICSKLSHTETSEFYKIFINSMGVIVKKFGGTVVKNIGDALLFYFPIDDIQEKETLKVCLDCCLALGDEHEEIVKKLEQQNLPLLDYRISATYGIVRIAKTSTSSVNDIFGTTVNRCAKINRSAPANGVIIGQDFYDSVKSLDGYFFKKIESEIVSPEHGYAGYIVSRAQKI